MTFLCNEPMICFGNFHSTLSRAFMIFLMNYGKYGHSQREDLINLTENLGMGLTPSPFLAVTEYWAFLVLNIVIFKFWSTPLNHLNFILN